MLSRSTECIQPGWLPRCTSARREAFRSASAGRAAARAPSASRAERVPCAPRPVLARARRPASARKGPALRASARAQCFLRGVNAAASGLVVAATLLLLDKIRTPPQHAIALIAFAAHHFAGASLVGIRMLYKRLDNLRRLYRNLQARHALAAMDRAAIIKADQDDLDPAL